MKILLPDHSEKCHSVTVHNGTRYVEEHLISRTSDGDYIDVSAYEGEDIRLEHSAADVRGNKQPPQYRAIARLDGVWYPYDIVAPAWGLPELTDPHPVDGPEAVGQDDPQPEDVDESVESLAPATEKKSRTRRQAE